MPVLYRRYNCQSTVAIRHDAGVTIRYVYYSEFSTMVECQHKRDTQFSVTGRLLSSRPRHKKRSNRELWIFFLGFDPLFRCSQFSISISSNHTNKTSTTVAFLCLFQTFIFLFSTMKFSAFALASVVSTFAFSSCEAAEGSYVYDPAGKLEDGVFSPGPGGWPGACNDGSTEQSPVAIVDSQWPANKDISISDYTFNVSGSWRRL